ncbi:unnamed protein product [Sphagnum balticum]
MLTVIRIAAIATFVPALLSHSAIAMMRRQGSLDDVIVLDLSFDKFSVTEKFRVDDPFGLSKALTDNPSIGTVVLDSITSYTMLGTETSSLQSNEIWHLELTEDNVDVSSCVTGRWCTPMKSRMFSEKSGPEFTWNYDAETLTGEGIADWYAAWLTNGGKKIPLPGQKALNKELKAILQIDESIANRIFWYAEYEVGKRHCWDVTPEDVANVIDKVLKEQETNNAV